MKNYSEMMTYSTYAERVEYLRQYGLVGNSKFDAMRFLNQEFYKTKEWANTRRRIITRDLGCDLACQDRPLDRVIIHHINPPTIDDFINHADCLLDEENLVCVSDYTHRLIHYGCEDTKVQNGLIERSPYDTAPWRKND